MAGRNSQKKVDWCWALGIAKELDVKAGDWVSLLISQPRWRRSNILQPNRERVQVTAILRLDGRIRSQLCLTGIASKHKINGVIAKIKSPVLN